MASTEAKVIHDHDYCFKNEKEKVTLKAVEKNPVRTSPDSMSLSPTYSCDSGIDSFATDLAYEFGKEGDDLLNFLLDDELYLELDSQKNEGNSDNIPATSDFPPDHGKSSKTLGTSQVSSENTADRNKKNAEAARENRKKRKVYLFGLEKEVTQLRAEKKVLSGKTEKLEGRLNDLQDEVDYLKSIVANQSMLSKLIQRVSMTPGISLSTSFCSSRKTTQEDFENQKETTVSTTRRSRKRGCNSQKSNPGSTGDKRCRRSGTGGVCLHVKENRVSLEFCRSCSKKAED